MAFGSSTGSPSDTSPEFMRKLGSNELFCHYCHNAGDLNVMTGLTLLTRHAIDEGLLKCALQEFQHTFPQLTSRIRHCPNGKCLNPDTCQNLHFTPMECPTLPLDITFSCKDMLHQKFDTNTGPLWRVQLITEASMDLANLGFGPELQAIVEDDASQETRWRYFLRYIQGKVNQTDILPYDEDEEGFRSFILMTFHPSITDQVGAFHLMRQFLVILDSILEEEGNQINQNPRCDEPMNLHLSIESLLPSKDSAFQIKDIFPFGKLVKDYVMPYKSPLENVLLPTTTTPTTTTASSPSTSSVDSNFFDQKTEILRGWLNEEETRELMAMLEEDDCSLHGVIMAAGLLAVSRILQDDRNKMLNCQADTLSLRVTNEMNLRQYCVVASQKMLGTHTTYHESDYTVPPVHDRTEFWKFAHELTVKHNASKGTKEPLQMLRIYNRMSSISGVAEQSVVDKSARLRNEMAVNVYGDLGHLMRRSYDAGPSANNFQSIDTWNRPLSTTKSNIRLEDVLHVVAAPHMGSPFTHSAHVLHDRLNYFLCYHTTYVPDQRYAFNVRDETINILRMAVEKPD